MNTDLREEFIRMLKEKYIVDCENTIERDNVLRYLKEEGFKLGPVTKTYLEQTEFVDGSDEFICPGFNGSYVSCWRKGVTNRCFISYEEYIELFEEPIPAEGLNESEFEAGLKTLYGTI